ncbi:tagaturonate epimerase family protein [Tundrisphaera sp. TA3]|uniref:tagaturonate epimerase family protein n=1 Tax=Tundrisphaera sp. TA3 TaxID=3435775 RepID=UPI003EBD477D
MSSVEAQPADDSPCVPLGLSPSFGFGDRLGLATPGHVEAMRRAGAGIEPIFPQQSIREMSRTQRTPRQVMDDALLSARHAGWSGRIGADADHLKTDSDADATAAVGFTFFTIDPSEHVDPQAHIYDESTLRSRTSGLAEEIGWLGYRGKSITLGTGTSIDFDEESILRATAKYGRAVEHAIALADHIKKACDARGAGHEIELSVDETEHPTTLAEHFLIADRCLGAGMKLVSLASRFVGDFEKGVDFKGDLAALERSLHDHAAIAAQLGPYKLSLHSGSDKLSIYPALARATRGMFHVKTAGTSYLEALRVVARREPDLFRRVIEFARNHYDADRATYHVSATREASPDPWTIADERDLERLYLGLWDETPAGLGFTQPNRQILHCTFGSTLTDATLGAEVRGVVHQYVDDYTEILADHFARHLDALRAGL